MSSLLHRVAVADKSQGDAYDSATNALSTGFLAEYGDYTEDVIELDRDLSKD